ncbi:nucleoside triphosphate pyrophosphohydrolase [Actinoplanes sp. TBRC 11911]|uniref:nucleoside triphosphate pyrophosphohydrolase n=1 Tax=Actinoplanes sp. TBRC 11911 TaxID=2729386 RepID=UPI00145C4147|nr:nucleoside triphosphate pyrophosphohydrolase [Actinoplanes sp. TBRC 11911]NMO55221.1 nucleoside triphosphate pyrophosphohydrolase [Actinoplanes sp. TBRC 11911]
MADSKLVRDLIPEIMRADGTEFETRVACSDELPLLLRDKLVEEAHEVADARDDRSVVEELADVLEVIHAYASWLGVGVPEIEQMRQAKRAQRGGFGAGIVLVSPPGESGCRRAGRCR